MEAHAYVDAFVQTRTVPLDLLAYTWSMVLDFGSVSTFARYSLADYGLEKLQ